MLVSPAICPVPTADSATEDVRRAPKQLPVVDTGRCIGCGWCVAACPEHVLALEPQGWRKTSVLLDASACTGCRKCEVRCPFRVISMVRCSLRAS